MISPKPENKGKAIAAFWIIFNSGGMIGALVAFGQIGTADESLGTISTATYLCELT